MMNGRFRREKPEYAYLEIHCQNDANKCDPLPYDKIIEKCVSAVELVYPSKKGTTDIKGKCKEGIEKAFKEYCKEMKDELRSCDVFYTTTNSPNFLPFIIVGVVGVIVILAIGIGIFCYYKKKKSAGKGQPMTGTTVGGTTVNGTTAKTGTKTNTGTMNAETTTAAPTARY